MHARPSRGSEKLKMELEKFVSIVELKAHENLNLERTGELLSHKHSAVLDFCEPIS